MSCSRPGQHLSTKHRAGSGHLVGELVATAGLIALIFALARTRRGTLAAPSAGAYIGAAYWFTSSTSFANPAVTIGRMFTDTFAGIAPSSVLPFIGMQVLGAAVGVAIMLVLYPDAAARAHDVVIPHTTTDTANSSPDANNHRRSVKASSDAPGRHRAAATAPCGATRIMTAAMHKPHGCPR
jgi:glycerol uptake facilitator-like aquaporin